MYFIIVQQYHLDFFFIIVFEYTYNKITLYAPKIEVSVYKL